jgi:hypothetical protein
MKTYNKKEIKARQAWVQRLSQAVDALTEAQDALEEVKQEYYEVCDPALSTALELALRGLVEDQSEYVFRVINDMLAKAAKKACR